MPEGELHREPIKKLFSAGGEHGVDLNEYLLRFLKPGQRLPWFSHYSIHLSYGPGGCDFKRIFRDAWFNIILVRTGIINLRDTNSKAIACIGFDLWLGEEDTALYVKQIQGVKGKRKYLKAFRWEKMLLALVVDLARKYQFQEVRVIRSCDSRWNTDSRKQRMYMLYDVTAKRSGFKYDEKIKKYVLQLAT